MSVNLSSDQCTAVVEMLTYLAEEVDLGRIGMEMFKKSGVDVATACEAIGLLADEVDMANPMPEEEFL